MKFRESLEARQVRGEGKLSVAGREGGAGLRLAQDRVVPPHQGTPVDAVVRQTGTQAGMPVPPACKSCVCRVAQCGFAAIKETGYPHDSGESCRRFVG
jgi:hypothetical protein